MLKRITYKKNHSKAVALPFFWMSGVGNKVYHPNVLVSTNDLKIAFEIGALFFERPNAVAIYNDSFVSPFLVDNFNKYIDNFNKHNIVQGYITDIDKPAIEYKTRKQMIDEVLETL